MQGALQEVSLASSEPADVNLRKVGLHGETWQFDNDDEFFASYRKDEVYEAFYWARNNIGSGFELQFSTSGTTIQVKMQTRADVERVFNVFESAAASSRLSEDMCDRQLREWLRIFIGHGRSPLWRELKDHLVEKHKFRVETYETQARAGLHISDILNKAKVATGFAILVLTAENSDSQGLVHARENVIHEVGLFQGKLGFNRAIVLLEDGCTEFSNLAGVQHIPFSKGDIKGAFGEVLATLRREFIDSDEDA